MSLVLAATLASTLATTYPTCSWDHRGDNPFVGDVVAAVDRYKDIPPSVREALKKRIAERRYDEIAVIKRDAIIGKYKYEPGIREMHFGSGQICGTVTRAKWTDADEELGLVYCESNHCVMIPTVCRNVSRITRLPGEPPVITARAPEPPPLETPVIPPPVTPPQELVFPAPGAGVVEAPGPTPTVVETTPPPVVPFSSRQSLIDPVPALPPAVPEPASALMMLAGVAALLAWRRRVLGRGAQRDGG